MNSTRKHSNQNKIQRALSKALSTRKALAWTLSEEMIIDANRKTFNIQQWLITHLWMLTPSCLTELHKLNLNRQLLTKLTKFHTSNQRLIMESDRGLSVEIRWGIKRCDRYQFQNNSVSSWTWILQQATCNKLDPTNLPAKRATERVSSQSAD